MEISEGASCEINNNQAAVPELILKTGFQSITHSIQFRPVTLKKGKDLVESEHVYKVQEYRKNGASYKISAEVIRQAAVSESPYTAVLYIDSNRNVIETSCTCVYNKSSLCKHIAGLIHYINTNQSRSKTDFQQQWGKPSARQFTKEKYSKGKDFCEMFPPAPVDQTLQAPEVDLSLLTRPSHLRTIMTEAREDKTERDVKSLINFLLDSVEKNSHSNDCAQCVKQTHFLVQQFPVYSEDTILQEELFNFYKECVELSQEQIVKLCCDTTEQANSKTWFSARRLRVSASKNVHSIKTRIKRTEESIVAEMMFPKKINTPGIRYGRLHERDALMEYERQYNVRVIKVGVIVSMYQPWLCASVDGVVLDGGAVQKIVELKCPITCENQPIVDFEADKSNIGYVQLKSGTAILKKSHIYYTQCQVQMYVCGTDTCDLFIWSPVVNGTCLIKVKRDEAFLKAVITKCEKFYFQQYLPKLYETTKEEELHVPKTSRRKRTFTGENIVNTI